ncbi:MAG: WecB/TagA/CpsF family glycosyltransferase [Flavobacteriales bacterium]|jgi:N-acetylglucosaminyldiphosphoundecaprenol N-acetyl-beta-D-mannosaminyltransferase|nr:WecB/TagA/CpsF family glycosyltransferase [Flavobacteriales bacterium]
MKRVTLFGLPFIAAKNHDGVVEEVLAWPLKKEHPQELPLLSTPNVDQVVKLHRKEHAELLGHIARARFVLPDGQPIVWVGNRKKGCELPARLAGSDLFPAVWNKLAARKSPIFMVLANDAIGEALRKENPEMHWLTPPFYSIADPKAEQQVVDAVFDALIARPVPLVFLGLGFPKQERLALALIEKLKAVAAPMPLFLLLGASYEFHAGLKKRAPMIFQKLGLEFFHRFLSEPKRMFRRYFVDDMVFFKLALKELRSR